MLQIYHSILTLLICCHPQATPPSHTSFPGSFWQEWQYENSKPVSLLAIYHPNVSDRQGSVEIAPTPYKYYNWANLLKSQKLGTYYQFKMILDAFLPLKPQTCAEVIKSFEVLSKYCQSAPSVSTTAMRIGTVICCSIFTSVNTLVGKLCQN